VKSTTACAAFLRGFGLKVGRVRKAGFAGRIRELVAGLAMLKAVVEPML
jgi:hypothetical protein